MMLYITVLCCSYVDSRCKIRLMYHASINFKLPMNKTGRVQNQHVMFERTNLHEGDISQHNENTKTKEEAM